MKNMRIENLLLAGLIAAVLTLTLLSGMAWRSATKADQASNQVMQAHRALTAVGQIMFNLTRAETAQRGYAIYGTMAYVKSRDESLLDVARAVGEAERFIAAPEQLENLHQLKKLIAQRMEIFRYKTRSANGRIVVAGFDSSAPLMDQIHRAIGRIVERENSGLLEGEAEHTFQRKVEHMSFISLSLLLPFLLISLFLRIRHALNLSSDGDVRRQNAALEESIRLKSEFMANMSHELRTSINAVMGFAELLKNGRSGKLSKVQAEYVNDIYSSGQHLLAMVNNILDLSKIEAGKMMLDLKPVEVAELLEHSLTSIKSNVVSQRLRLHLDAPPGLGEIHVDPLMARQICHNLLSNAVKFTSGDGQLKVCARLVPRSEVGQLSGSFPSRVFPLAESEFTEFLEISVSDSGIGITREGLDNLFLPYARGDCGPACDVGGTGLGLMLVKQFAELHGGTVGVESAEGHGSRFIVWLPSRSGTTPAAEDLAARQSTLNSIMKARESGARAVRELAQQRTFVSA